MENKSYIAESERVMATAVVLLAITVATAVATVGVAIAKAKQISKAATQQDILTQKSIDLDRAQAEVETELNALASVKALRALLARNAAAFAGRGVLLNTGTPLRSAEENLIELNEQLRIDRLGLGFTTARLDLESTASVIRKQQLKKGARLEALGTSLDAAFGLGSSIIGRGKTPSGGDSGGGGG